MDNSTLYNLENLGAKVYFFGECVWASILKIPISTYKIAIIGDVYEHVVTLFSDLETQKLKNIIIVHDGNSKYEFYILDTFEEIPTDRIPLNNAILSLNGKVYRAEELQTRVINVDSSVFLDYPEEMLRVCRIAAQTRFKIGVPTWLSIKENSRLIKTTVKKSPVYIGQQLNDILLSDSIIGFNYLWETGLLQYILPEFNQCYEISQTRRGENSNVFIHTLLAINAAEKTPLQRWTMLFHDMAKPATMEITPDNRMHFFKHEIVGAKLATTYLKKYKMSAEFIAKVKTLIENHMFDADPKLTPKGVRRLIRRVGKENIHELLKVRIADRSGSSHPPSMDKIYLLKQKIEKELPNV